MVALPDSVVELPDPVALAPPTRRRTACTSSWSYARAAGMWLQSMVGIGYLFGAISAMFKDALGYNQRQVAVLGIAKDLGDCVGFLAGSLFAMLPPWAMLLIGAMQNFLKYGWLWLIVTKKTPVLPLSMTDGLAIISASDWMSFSADCYVAHPNGTCAEIVFSKRSQDKLHESPEARVILDEDLDQSINDANGDLEDNTPYVRTDPESTTSMASCGAAAGDPSRRRAR